jgi:hypothetical protein
MAVEAHCPDEGEGACAASPRISIDPRCHIGAAGRSFDVIGGKLDVARCDDPGYQGIVTVKQVDYPPTNLIPK